MVEQDTEDHDTEDHDMKGQDVIGRLRRTMQQIAHTGPIPPMSSNTLLFSSTRNLSRVKLLFHSQLQSFPHFHQPLSLTASPVQVRDTFADYHARVDATIELCRLITAHPTPFSQPVLTINIVQSVLYSTS